MNQIVAARMRVTGFGHELFGKRGAVHIGRVEEGSAQCHYPARQGKPRTGRAVLRIASEPSRRTGRALSVAQGVALAAGTYCPALPATGPPGRARPKYLATNQYCAKHFSAFVPKD